MHNWIKNHKIQILMMAFFVIVMLGWAEVIVSIENSMDSVDWHKTLEKVVVFK